MKNYRITVAYDGTAYHGWLEQPGQATVVGTLVDAYESVFGQKIDLLGASRTDAGVHALGQVARFHSNLEIDSQRWVRAWNGALPADIKIRTLEEVSPQFHPHQGVWQKVYYYHIFLKRPLPFCARYGYYYSCPLDLEKLAESLTCFEGIHNFWTFRVEGGAARSDICTMRSVHFEQFRRFDLIRIVVCGDRFLYNMVRRMVGAALVVSSSERRSVDEIRRALEHKTPRDYFPTAPAHGLVLRRVIYR